MKTPHLSIIVILFVSVFANIEHVFADNDSISHLNITTTDYGGNGIMVNSNQTVTPFLPSPPLGMYPYTSKIFSVFQIDPEIIHPNDTSSIHILVTNNANFTLYDVNLGESVNDSKSVLFSNIHKIDILNPNQTKTIYGTLHVSTDVQPTDYYDIWWNVVAKNQTGNMMESMQFHRNLPIIQNLPQYCCGKPITITLESPLKQFKHGTIPRDVTCWQGFQLIFKTEDNSPACVKPDTATKLVERGWATHEKQSYHVYFPGLPPPIIDTRIAKIVSGTQEAQSIVGYYVGIPHYLPPGYSMQTIEADNSSKFVKILASNFPVTQNTTSVEFMDRGGIMIYMEPGGPAFNQTNWTILWIKQTPGSSAIKINGYDGVISDITKGTRFDEKIDIPAQIVIFQDNVLVEISGFLHPDELTKIAEGMLTK